jgi:hypothetical protein
LIECFNNFWELTIVIVEINDVHNTYNCLFGFFVAEIHFKSFFSYIIKEREVVANPRTKTSFINIILCSRYLVNASEESTPSRLEKLSELFGLEIALIFIVIIVVVGIL